MKRGTKKTGIIGAKKQQGEQGKPESGGHRATRKHWEQGEQVNKGNRENRENRWNRGNRGNRTTG